MIYNMCALQNICLHLVGIVLLQLILAGYGAVTTTTQEPTTEQSNINIGTRNVDTDTKVLASMCPNMYGTMFEAAIPRDESKAGQFEEFNTGSENDVDLSACIAACCENKTCNVVFVFKRKCYHIRCNSNEACLPKKHTNVKDRLQMVLVNPVRRQNGEPHNTSWLEVLKSAQSSESNVLWQPLDELNEENSNALSFWKQPRKFFYSQKNQEPNLYDEEDFPIAEKRMNQMLIDNHERIMPEELGIFGPNAQTNGLIEALIDCNFDNTASRCPLKEECVLISDSSSNGICKCVHGYVRNRLRECVPTAELEYRNYEEVSSGPKNIILSAAASDPIPFVIENQKDMQNFNQNTEMTTKSDMNKKIIVSVVSKEVQLPDKETTLAAFSVPENPEYKYLWTLITQPKGPMNGTISDQSNSKVHLSNLSEGLYTFKVTVTGPNGTFGESMANVTVLPEKRINQAPQVIISPNTQILRPPITNTILDGSSSTDDDKIVSWHWEVVSGPIGYQPTLPDVSTLQLVDLTAPGNYSFQLTVKDSDNVTNSTTATITVLQPTDYPPVANAGEAVILYLPNNNVTLNGTASTDDHEIVAWEWTKDASSETKAVDMQNTRTPYLRLSNLEEGMYTFILKVTDGSNQTSTANVHVFVKPPTNSPPVAVAVGNLTINLPQNWASLNGSSSTDDIRIIAYEWKQLTGPNNARILKANESVANATSLTVGFYTFQLTVTDEHNNSASDNTWIKVVQEKNAAPVAHAGGDQNLELPINALYLNGSKSSDDLAVVKYLWTREDTSLAAGTVIGGSDKEVLILTNLVPGRYVFKLTVSDEQGLTGSDTVSIVVRPDPLLLSLIELTLPMGPSSLMYSELNTIVQKIGLLLGDMKITVRDLKYDTSTDATILVFYVAHTDRNGKISPVGGLFIEQLLKDKLQRDASILGTVFVDVRTTVCQNKCSNHGICNPETRACVCEAFWMPSGGFFWGVDEANCDWSILYVFIGITVCLGLLSALFWSIACACKQSKKPQRNSGTRPKVQKYSLIGAQDEETPHFGRQNSSLTDSDTDSDVLFETRTKPNGILRSNGTAKTKSNQRKYSHKVGRKIKT